MAQAHVATADTHRRLPPAGKGAGEATDAKRNMKAVLLGVTEFPPGDISADIKCRLNPVNAMVTTASSPAQRERPAGVWRRRILFRA
jgi:hypothetical protein